MNDGRCKLMLGKTAIPYRVKRSPRRKRTIALIIEPGSDLTILAPATAELSRIEAVARRRTGWILRKLADIRERAHSQHSHEFVDGESLTYLGRQYRLRVSHAGTGKPSCKLRGGWLEVVVPASVPMRDRQRTVAQAVQSWYRARARSRLMTRTKIWSERLGIAFGQLLITSPAKRWGSCDAANNIRINWRIMMAPLSLIDYVVAHELCHVKHRNHSDEFWRLLASVMPDCERRRAALRKLGARYSL
ncbi:MAG TPA: SprT family zinc-dependent metalloprotease [Alphaproteobacteria bacterium]|nr:SprT family zinc-dependent metalloprotease [Alphaproteobacteria bacterium]